MNFEFFTAGRIVFGPGEFARLPALVAERGARCFIVTGHKALEEAGPLAQLTAGLQERGLACERYAAAGEPTVSMVNEALAQARDFAPDVIVGVGGGSVIDLGKALAGLLTNGGEIVDYLEGVGAGRQIEKPALPYIAVPTTAGTGSEVTKNAVISSDDRTFKKSIRSEHLIPDIALVDSRLTYSMPPELTAACGFDALTQLIEAYTSNQANPLTGALAGAGIERAARSLYSAWSNGQNAAAREDLALAALYGGMALANAGLGAVHGLASPLGALFPIPHGAACATLLPGVIEANVKALLRRDPDHPALVRYSDLAILFCRTDDDPHKLVERLRSMLTMMSVPKLGTFGVTAADIPRIVAGSRGSSMKYNPVKLSDDELTAILEAAL